MNQSLRPKLPIPPQLTVSEEGSFAYYTFTHRVPAIIKQVIAENNYQPEIEAELQALAQNLLHEKVRPINNDGGTDLAAWIEYIKPYQSQSWLDCPFYFIETYFYRRLLEAIEYFAVEQDQIIDPFKLQKRLGLTKAMPSVRREVKNYHNIHRCPQERNDIWRQTLLYLLYLNLWGNRADLSLNPTKAGDFNHEQIQIQNQGEYILLNDAPVVANYIKGLSQQRVDYIVDNSGFELISDLLIVDFLLTSNAAEIVYLHLKSHPIFVSDAMIKDVEETIDFLADDAEPEVQQLAARLKNYLTDKRLKLVDNLFWTSPLFFWSMPEQLRQDLAQSSLVFIKGDANYRRLVGDCYWKKTSSFADICGYFPAPFVTLRTLKSEVIVGLEQN
ncbi:MAG: damage-control phosphatase ARMT1 family protein, partial [Cyanobacteria bacterium P01_A01_bin.83]